MTQEPRRTVEVPIEPEVLPPHSRRSWVLFTAMGLAVLAMVAIVLSQRVLSPPTRGDVDVDSVGALPGSAGDWDVVATWSRPAPGGCVVLGWKVATSDRGYEVASQRMAPPDAVFPTVCASPTASIVLERTKDDPTGHELVVNGKKLVIVRLTSLEGYTTGRAG